MKNCNSCESCIAWWCDLYEQFLDSDENGPLPCEECAELAQAALKLRRALDGKNPTPNTEEERRRALLEEYTDVIHCALVLDLEMDLDQIRKKTERWIRRLGIRNGDCGIKGASGCAGG